MYSNSKIYKLVCNQTGLTYYGSTTQPLYKRKHQHEVAYKRFTEGKLGPHYKAFEILEKGDYVVVLVEEFSCENKEQLQRRERFHIENNECVNKNIPTRTKQEWRDDNKDNIKAYREDNKDKIKVYRENNKDKKKEWREDNEDKVKAHRDANKEKHREYMIEYKKTEKYKQSMEKYTLKIQSIISKGADEKA